MTEEKAQTNTIEESAKIAQEQHDKFRATIKELVQHIAREAKRDKPPRSVRFNEAPIGSQMFCNYIAKDPKTKRVLSEEIFYDPAMFWDAPAGALYAVLWHEYGHGQERHQRVERDDDAYYEPDEKKFGQGAVHELRNVKMDIILDANNRADHPGLILPYRALYEESFPRVLQNAPQGGLEEFAELSGLSEGARNAAKALEISARRPHWFLIALKHEGYWHQEDVRTQIPEDERQPNPYLAEDAILSERFASVREAAREVGNLRRSTVLRSDTFNRDIAPVYFSMLEKRNEEMVETTQLMLDDGKMTLPDAAELEKAILDKARQTKQAEIQKHEESAKSLESHADELEETAKSKIEEAKRDVEDIAAKAAELERHASDMRTQAHISREQKAGGGSETLAQKYEEEAAQAAAAAKDLMDEAVQKEQSVEGMEERIAQAIDKLRRTAQDELERAQAQIQEAAKQPDERQDGPPKDAQDAVKRILAALEKLKKSQPKRDGAEQQEVEGRPGEGSGDGAENEGEGDKQTDGSGEGKDGKGGKEGKGQGKGEGKGEGKGKGQGKGQGQGEGKGKGKGSAGRPQGPTRITYQSSPGEGNGGWISVDKDTRTKRLEELGRWGISERMDEEYKRIRHKLDEEALNELVNGLVLAFAEDRQRVILTDLPHGSLPTARKVEALRRRYSGEQLPAVREVRKTIERFMGIDIIVSNDHSGSMCYLGREDAAKAANVSIASACLRVNTEVARRMRRMGLSEREIAAAPPLRYLGLLFSNDVKRMNSRGWESPLLGSQTNMDDRELDEEKFVVDMFGSYEQMRMGDNNDQLSAAHALHQAYGRDFPGIVSPEERVKIIYFVTDGGCDVGEMGELLRFLHGKSETFPRWTRQLLEHIEPGCATKIEERIRKYRDQLFAVGIGIGGAREFVDVYNEGRMPNEGDPRVYEENDVMVVSDQNLKEMPRKILRLTGAKFHSPRFRMLRARFAKKAVGRMIKQKIGS